MMILNEDSYLGENTRRPHLYHSYMHSIALIVSVAWAVHSDGFSPFSAPQHVSAQSALSQKSSDEKDTKSTKKKSGQTEVAEASQINQADRALYTAAQEAFHGSPDLTATGIKNHNFRHEETGGYPASCLALEKESISYAQDTATMETHDARYNLMLQSGKPNRIFMTSCL